MIKLEDESTWPPIGTLWQHTNGNVYEVEAFTNKETDRQDKYPTTIVYSNVINDKLYSRKLIDWDRSMTRVKVQI